MPLRAPVAQLDRALACGAKGRKFESCQVYHDKTPTFYVGVLSWYASRESPEFVRGLFPSPIA